MSERSDQENSLEINSNSSKQAILKIQDSFKNSNEYWYIKDIITDINTLSENELVEMLNFFMQD